jgi:hypothetical protein
MKPARFSIFLLLVCCRTDSIAQEPQKAVTKSLPSNDSLVTDVLKKLQKEREGANPDVTFRVPETDIEKMPEEIRTAYYASRKAALDHDKWAWEQIRLSHQWQFWSGVGAYFVSIGIVIVGIWMSCLQFWAYYRAVQERMKIQKEAVAKTDDPVLLKQLATDVEVTPKGVKLSTPVLGVTILALSLAFFYFYLNVVYPINAIDHPRSVTTKVPNQ